MSERKYQIDIDHYVVVHRLQDQYLAERPPTHEAQRTPERFWYRDIEENADVRDNNCLIKFEVYWHGQLCLIEYDRWGVLHNDNGPASLSFHNNGMVSRIEWVINGDPHKIDGPAFIGFYPNGARQYLEWLQNNKYHRADGPARQYWASDGILVSSEWYWHGKPCSQWQILAQAILPHIHALLPQPIAEEIIEQLTP